jgi:hypothetical protein
MRDIAISCSVLCCLVLVFVWGVFSSPKSNLGEQQYRQYAAIFHPAKLRSEVYSDIVGADGVPVRYGMWDFVAISASLDREHKQKLYEQGALFVFSKIRLTNSTSQDLG